MSAAKTPRKPAGGKQPAPRRKPARDEAVHPAARPFLWLLSDGVRKGFMYVVGLGALVFIGLDFVIPRHAHFGFEAWKGFFAVFGFLAFSFVVLAGWPLRALTGRPEDYYPESREDD